MQKSFTLIELMTVIGIIAILAGLMLVGYNIFFTEANIGSSMRFDSSIHHSLGYALVGDWKMDDNAANSTVVDTSGNGNDGTFYSDGSEDNTANHSVDGANGRALEFNSTKNECVNSYFDQGILKQGNEEKEFTLSAWIKPSELYLDGGLIVGRIGWHGGLLTEATNAFEFHIWLSDKSSAVGVESGTISNYKNWHHLVGLYNKRNMSIYVDGKLKDSVIFENSFYNYNDNFYIGSTCGGNPFKGSIDQVRVYKAALSASQIKQQYYTGLQRLYKKGLISREEYIRRIVKK